MTEQERIDHDEWKAMEFSESLMGSVQAALEELMDELIYAKEETEVRIIQGMIRAYRDVLNICESGEA